MLGDKAENQLRLPPAAPCNFLNFSLFTGNNSFVIWGLSPIWAPFASLLLPSSGSFSISARTRNPTRKFKRSNPSLVRTVLFFVTSLLCGWHVNPNDHRHSLGTTGPRGRLCTFPLHLSPLVLGQRRKAR